MENGIIRAVKESLIFSHEGHVGVVRGGEGSALTVSLPVQSGDRACCRSRSPSPCCVPPDCSPVTKTQEHRLPIKIH